MSELSNGIARVNLQKTMQIFICVFAYLGLISFASNDAHCKFYHLYMMLNTGHIFPIRAHSVLDSFDLGSTQQISESPLNFKNFFLSLQLNTGKSQPQQPR